MDYQRRKDLRRRILTAVIIIHIIVITSIILMSCQVHEQAKIIEKEPEPVVFEIKVPETLKDEDIKIMAKDCHAMQVPAGTLVGSMVTVRDGHWISNRTALRMAAVMMLFDGGIDHAP